MEEEAEGEGEGRRTVAGGSWRRILVYSGGGEVRNGRGRRSGEVWRWFGNREGKRRRSVGKMRRRTRNCRRCRLSFSRRRRRRRRRRS